MMLRPSRMPKPRTTNKPKPKPTPSPTKGGKDKNKTKPTPKPTTQRYPYIPTEKELKRQKKQMNSGTSRKMPPAMPGTPVDKTSYGLQGKTLTRSYKTGETHAKKFFADPRKNQNYRSTYMLIAEPNKRAAWKKGYADQMAKLKKNKASK